MNKPQYRDVTKGEISRQSAAAASLIADLTSDDAQLRHDMVEGETSFFEAVDAGLDEIQECQIMASGLREHIKRLSARLKRIDSRAERVRGMIEQAFAMADIQSHAFDRATISQKSIPPKLIVTDESRIPARFFVQQPPSLDKKALLSAVKDDDIPGAALGNGGKTVQIRWA